MGQCVVTCVWGSVLYLFVQKALNGREKREGGIGPLQCPSLFYGDINPIWWWDRTNDLSSPNHLKWPHFQTPLHWRLAFSRWVYGSVCRSEILIFTQWPCDRGHTEPGGLCKLPPLLKDFEKQMRWTGGRTFLFFAYEIVDWRFLSLMRIMGITGIILKVLTTLKSHVSCLKFPSLTVDRLRNVWPLTAREPG